MTKNKRKIELLAPAKNLATGIEAINHGADAVYIGAPRFSARSAAGNTIEDLTELVQYAHQFGVKIYVAFNTILRDEELLESEQLIWELYKIGVDALIVQDMGILMLNLPPIALHASTQTDNRDVGKVKFLEATGFSQIVLARELTVDEIKTISADVSTPLEAFVHGALCVCYSGQCYLSEAISKRSANRGSCAQFCRLPYTLLDSNGEIIIQKKHLLSLKDLNLSEHLEEMIDAGISSLKIEGRLKDISYVKNTVAYYRQKIDKILANRSDEYVRASSGKSTYTFEPNLNKSFNRGFTEYFFHDRTSDMWSLNSPKSVGEPIGIVKELTKTYFTVSGNIQLNNGDGLCFLNKQEELEGIRVNKVDNNRIYCTDLSALQSGVQIYRNNDHEFEKILNNKTAERKINTQIVIKDISTGFSLQITDEDNNVAVLNFDQVKELAQKSQEDNIKNNLRKTGNTIFNVESVEICFAENWFIPASLITEWRRQLIDKLLSVIMMNYRQEVRVIKPTYHAFPTKSITYLGNVLNEKSRQFYVQHQSVVNELAFEKKAQKDVALMFTRHCIKQSIGWCPKETREKSPYEEPFFLLHKETKLRLSFDCKSCEMKVYQI